MILKKVFRILNKSQTKDFYLTGSLNIIFAIIELIGLVSLSIIILLIVSPEVYLEKLNSFNFLIFESFNEKMTNFKFVLYFFASFFFISTILKFLIKKQTIVIIINQLL